MRYRSLKIALGFFSRMCSLVSLGLLKSENHLITALGVETWPGVLEVIQKHIKGWRVGLEAEMEFPVSDTYSFPMKAKSFVGSVMANFCGSHYPLHMSMVKASSQRVMIDKAFSVPARVRLRRMSHHSHQQLKKKWPTVPGTRVEDLTDTWGDKLLSLERGNSSDLEKQSTNGKVIDNVPAVDGNDSTHTKMMDFEFLLEASGEHNVRSINLTHGDYPCHCLAQTAWYP